jgi:hypothetical protein
MKVSEGGAEDMVGVIWNVRVNTSMRDGKGVRASEREKKGKREE